MPWFYPRTLVTATFKMKLDFDKIFKIPHYGLLLNRSHPYIKKDKKWFLQAGLMHGLFTLVFCLVLYNIIYHDLKLKNFSQFCKNGVLSIVYIVTTFQYGVLVIHQKSLVKLISYVKKDYILTKNLTPEEKSVVEIYIKQGLYVCRQWLVISIMGAVLFLVKNISLTVYYYWIDEFKLVPFYELVYPKVIEDNKNNIYIYISTYALLLMYDLYAAIMFAAYVPIGPILMLHASGQLELVKMKIHRLFEEVNDNVVMEKLKEIIEHLQNVYRFVEVLKDTFKVAYELTLKATTLVLPITFYEVIAATNRGEFALEFITFIIGGIIITSAPCYYSDLLMEKGEDVRMALYSCGWELRYDRRMRTTLQILLVNALRPIAIRTVFRTLCLDALTDLYQQSYTIFNLMNAMWE